MRHFGDNVECVLVAVGPRKDKHPELHIF
jgi:hypothetical protein